MTSSHLLFIVKSTSLIRRVIRQDIVKKFVLSLISC